MNDDLFFRNFLIAGLVVLFPIAAFHRVKATTDEWLDRRQEGLPLLLGIRLMGAACLLGVLAFLIDPEWMAWASLPIPTWGRWLGVFYGALTAGLLIWTFVSLGRNITDTVVTRRDHTLVTTGPYRWVRHPFYVSFALATITVSLLTANWFLLAAWSAVLVLIVIRTSIEEQKLVERFGDGYRTYMERTGRFWPKK